MGMGSRPVLGIIESLIIKLSVMSVKQKMIMVINFVARLKASMKKNFLDEKSLK